MSSPPRAGPAAHCFKCHAGDFLQGVPEYLQPLLLSKGVLLGANHVDVMGDIISRVIPRLSLPLGEKPGRDLLGRGCVTFNSKTQHQVSQRHVRSRASGGFKTVGEEDHIITKITEANALDEELSAEVTLHVSCGQSSLRSCCEGTITFPRMESWEILYGALI